MRCHLESPDQHSYDIIIIGGALYGSSIAWFLSNDPCFSGKILVIEKDPSYEFSSTARTNSCIRQQFSKKINIEISQFGAHYIKNFRSFMNERSEIPNLNIDTLGYMYLAKTEKFAEILKINQILPCERINFKSGLPSPPQKYQIFTLKKCFGC